MIIKTTELTSRALDWAVGVAVGHDVELIQKTNGTSVVDGNWNTYSPTTNWGQLGPILSECMHYCKRGAVVVVGVQVKVNESLITAHGSAGDLETAACRAIVAAKLGDTVDVPEVLV